MLQYRLTRRSDREAEGARLLSEYGPQAHLGFESLLLRHLCLILNAYLIAFYSGGMKNSNSELRFVVLVSNLAKAHDYSLVSFVFLALEKI